MSAEDEKDLKVRIHALLCSLGKRTNEKQLRKAYREQEGQNINTAIEKLYGPQYTFYQFLRFKCNDMCDTFRLDGEIKIEKFAAESTKHIEQMNKARKKNNNKRSAPKLNYPINHLRVRSSHLNPQGFSRMKYINLDPFADVDEREEWGKDLSAEHKITLGNFLADKVDVNINGENQASTAFPLSCAVASLALNETADPSNALEARNSCDFPQLATKDKKGESTGASSQGNQPGNVCSYSELFSKFKPSQSHNDTKMVRKKLVLRHAIHTNIDEEKEDCDSDGSEVKLKRQPVAKMVKKSKDVVSSSSDDEELEEFCEKLSSIICSMSSAGVNLSDLNCSQNQTDEEEEGNDDEEDANCDGIEPFEEKEGENTTATLSFNDPLFLMDYPDLVMDDKKKISAPKLREVKTKLNFPVFITTVYSPSQFYFQCDDEALQNLTRVMQEFYHNIPSYGLKIDLTDLKVGQVVAAKMDGIWNRAEVQSINEGRIELLFVDYGVFLTRPITFIRYLPLSFTTTPAKAHRGMLFGVESDGVSEKWSDSARNFFFLMVKDKELQASIRSRDDNGVFALDIMENETTASTTIAESMIESFCGKPSASEGLEENTFPYAVFLPR